MRTFVSLILASLVVLPAGAAADATPAQTQDINYNTYLGSSAETKALVQRVMTGLGGETALRAVRAIHKVANIDETNSQGKKLQTLLDGVAVFPTSLYAKIELPSGSFTAVATPDMAYMYPANARIEHAALKLNEEEKSTLTRYFYEEPLLILRNRIDPSYLFAPGGKARLNGTDLDVLCVHAVGADMKWYIDPAGRVVRTSNGTKVTDFGDWRTVNGVTVPFSVRTENEGHVSLMKYKEFTFNPQIETAALFAKPTLWMTRNSLPALGRRFSSRSSGFGDYVNSYISDYGMDSGGGDTFETYIYSIYVENYDY